MGLWGWLMMLAFWALVIGGIVWAIRQSTVAPRQHDQDAPLHILDERLARGDIEREDYEERRRVLESHR
jgi:putative membrane protein